MRVLKLFFLSNEAQWRMGEVRHLLSRYQMEELFWAQIISSPEGHLIGMLDGSNINATARFFGRLSRRAWSAKDGGRQAASKRLVATGESASQINRQLPQATD